MEIFERITTIIKMQGLTKREFAKRLISLEPKLKTTGEIPTEKTIYKYLNGSINIRIELIPYIAQALNITEQEIFLTSQEKRFSFFRKMVQTASDDEVAIIKKRLATKYQISEVLKNDTVDDCTHEDELIKHVITLLKYAPIPLLESLHIKLKDIKEYTKTLDRF